MSIPFPKVEVDREVELIAVARKYQAAIIAWRNNLDGDWYDLRRKFQAAEKQFFDALDAVEVE